MYNPAGLPAAFMIAQATSNVFSPVLTTKSVTTELQKSRKFNRSSSISPSAENNCVPSIAKIQMKITHTMRNTQILCELRMTERSIF